MSPERIREAILSEARREAERIEAEARARFQERLAAATEALEEEFGRRLHQARDHAQRESDRKVAHARSQHNLALLELRNRILDEVFQEAARRLANLPDEQYRQFVKGRLKEAAGSQGGELLCNRRDAARLAPVVEELNSGRPTDARLVLVPGDRPSLGGVVLRTGKFEIDLSLDTQMAQVREQLAPEIAEKLFPPDVTV